MEFVSPLMLAGLAGIAIPVLIHLFNRRTARSLDWGAYRFLQKSMLKRRRRVLLEETLLLISRCLIIAFAVLAIARPFIRPQSRVPWPVVLPLVLLAVTAVGAACALGAQARWRNRLIGVALLAGLLAAGAVALERRLDINRYGRGTARDVAIIVDGSASMALTRDGVSNHQRVLAEIEADIRDADRSIAFGLIRGGALPRRLTRAPLNDPRTLFAVLEDLRPAAGTMDVPAALAAAAALLAQGANPVKQIVIYGDGQAAGWHPGDETRWQVVRTLFEQLPSPPQVIWRTLELPETLRNIAVDAITPLQAIVGTDRETTLQVTLRNTGEQAVTPRRAQLEVEDTILERTVIGQILPGATRVITFNHRFDTPGAKTLRARVEADDDIPTDDEAVRVLQVLGTLRVLLVEGNPGARFDASTTGFLSAALRPELQRRVEDADPGLGRDFLVAPVVETAAELARRTSFEDFVVIVLADVARLPDATRERLAAFTARGGGLLITPGTNTRADFYNDWSWRGEPVLPLPLRTFQTERRIRRRPSLDPTTLSGGLVRTIIGQNDLGRASIGGWWRLGAETHPERVEGLLTSGEPFLASRRLGRGTVAVTALPLDASLSNLPTLNTYLPLVHEIIYGLANPATAQLNVPPSASPVILLAPGATGVAAETPGLTGAYYPTRDFTGRPRVRIDPELAFNWGEGAPMQGFPRDHFTVRWTGSFIPPQDGTYTLRVEADDTARLWLGGREDRQPRHLLADTAYELRVDYAEQSGHASVRLLAEGPGLTGVIPARQLRPLPPEALERGRMEWPTTVHPESAPSNTVAAAYVQTAAGLALHVGASLEPGAYRARPHDAIGPLLEPVAAHADGDIPFVITTDTAESELTPLPEADVLFIRRFIELQTATQDDDVATALRGRRFGREIWRMLAAAALVLLLLELLLSRWIAIQRQTGSEEKIEFGEAPAGPSPFHRQLDNLRNRNTRANGAAPP